MLYRFHSLGRWLRGIPLAKLVAQGHDAFLGAGLLLVAARAAEDDVVVVARDRVEQRHRLERVARAVGALAQAAVVDVVLDRRDLQAQAQALDGRVAEREHLVEVVAGVDVQQLHRHARGPERLGREVKHHHGVLAAAEKDDGLARGRNRLAEDVDALGLERAEGAECAAVGASVGCSRVNPAFGLVGARPAAGARVLARRDLARARLAADARVARATRGLRGRPWAVW